MHISLSKVIASLCAMALTACAQQPGEISRDTQPFDAIAESATVSLLGNEPFWSIKIEPGQEGFAARYSTPENIEGTAFSVTRFAGNNGVGFSGQLDAQAVQIALTPGDCSDSMSDRSYPYTATVALGDVTLFGCGYTSDQPFAGDEMP